MTFKEIIEELQKQNISIEAFAYNDMKDPLPVIGKWKEIDQYGGEGEGETWWSVKYFPDHDVYAKVNGRYYSYDGTNFDSFEEDVHEVKPKEKTITVYE